MKEMRDAAAIVLASYDYCTYYKYQLPMILTFHSRFLKMRNKKKIFGAQKAD